MSRFDASDDAGSAGTCEVPRVATAPNENLRIGHFTDGIRTLLSVLTH